MARNHRVWTSLNDKELEMFEQIKQNTEYLDSDAETLRYLIREQAQREVTA